MDAILTGVLVLVAYLALCAALVAGWHKFVTFHKRGGGR